MLVRQPLWEYMWITHPAPFWSDPMTRRLPRYLTLAAVIMSLAACAGSPTEPAAKCAKTTNVTAPSCPSLDYVNPNV